MNDSLKRYLDDLSARFAQIRAGRATDLKRLAEYIAIKQDKSQDAKLIFICTHNSRRSHLAQIWAQTCAAYYNLERVETFSGGTEATEFNTHAIHALKEAGFSIRPSDGCQLVDGGEPEASMLCFSKVYDHAANPTKGFAAIMTCSSADESCPTVYGAEERFALTYEDPKKSDGSGNEARVYGERCAEIALEMLFVFNEVKSLNKTETNR